MLETEIIRKVYILIYLNFYTVLDKFGKIQWSLPCFFSLYNRLCHKILKDSTTIRKYKDINI